ncbi:MAG: adenylyltransferase/cytidyltransferase family protein [Dehalococcoidia bacterium]
MKRVAVSGGFDPIHVGHIRHIKHASKLGDLLIVILTRDDQLIAKKGYVFMPYEEREEILKALKWVDMVVPNIDDTIEAAESLEQYKPDIFAKGGDRTSFTMPEREVNVCNRIRCELVYGVGGYEKVESSSELVKQLFVGTLTNPWVDA